MSRTVYVVMVADLFHHGHVEFLRRARELGDSLVVGLTPDEKATIRKRRPIMSIDERIKVVEACRYVDSVTVHSEPTCDALMRNNGYDLKVYATVDENENRRLLERYQRQGLSEHYYQRIPYTSSISTTRILKRIASRMDELKSAPRPI
ncbi:MAG: hypothetical protein DHS20C01_01350 [marine bacterium B5-7]|nr:MAG: hypothetical protein DHS20C01_01350 [marine bacterium B5-7]